MTLFFLAYYFSLQYSANWVIMELQFEIFGVIIMFQTRIKELREAAGYKSQQAFADALGTSQSTIGNWESGRRHPKRTRMIELAEFFGITVDDLLDIEDKKEMPSIEKNEPTHNIVKIAGRDGSMFECTVSDSQMEFIKQMLVNLKPIDDENV